MAQIKKKYERPKMKVFELVSQGPLICTSGGGLGNPGGYDDGDDPFAP